MGRPGETVNASVLASPIRIDRSGKSDIRRIVFVDYGSGGINIEPCGNAAFFPIDLHHCFPRRRFVAVVRPAHGSSSMGVVSGFSAHEVLLSIMVNS